MEVIAQRQCFNYLVAVIRGYGGQHLGPTIFQHIKDAANPDCVLSTSDAENETPHKQILTEA